MSTESERRIQQELQAYDENVNVHDLPEIYHYWSNTYLRPMFEEFGFSHPDELFANHMYESASACDSERPTFISIGAGNCDTEVRIAKLLKKKGLDIFSVDCLDLNANMLRRGRDLAEQEGVLENLSFVEGNFNEWKANKKYTSVIANQALHHVENLEGLFDEVEESLDEKGTFIVNDMIGRNGHMRWPEALEAVHHFWQELPDDYRYNHQLKRHESVYENWDCSAEGFEGIRAQDILPLLVERFNFKLFVGMGNVIDIFVDRCFGHNFDINKEWDRAFIDKVHEFDETSILNGRVKPTHMLAVVTKASVEDPLFSRGLSPEFCVRDPSPDRISEVPRPASSGFVLVTPEGYRIENLTIPELTAILRSLS